MDSVAGDSLPSFPSSHTAVLPSHRSAVPSVLAAYDVSAAEAMIATSKRKAMTSPFVGLNVAAIDD